MSLLEIYKKIPVYPNSVCLIGKYNLPRDVPICEDEKGKVSFLSAKDKKRCMDALRKKQKEGKCQ